MTAGLCTGPNNTCSQLTTTIPSITSGTDFFITVTTPGGTSAYVPTPGSTSFNSLHYSVPVPQVSSISVPGNGTPQGAIGGGTPVVISGSGFFDANNFPTQINFCTSSTNCLSASNVNVTSSTNITASTPAVTAPGTWYLQVQTIGGSTSNTAVTFNFNTVQVPLVINISPSTGGPHSAPAVTQVTVTGANFLTGETAAAFYLYNGGTETGSPITASVTVTSPTALTVALPSTLSKGTSGNQYVLIVTTTVTPNTYSSQPYNVAGDVFQYTG